MKPHQQKSTKSELLETKALNSVSAVLPSFSKPSETRSVNMRAIRSKNMKPELTVRRLVHNLGFRFRLHQTNLAGKPDLVFAKRKKVIFVHGCFWHSHTCKKAHVPRSNEEYWRVKLRLNLDRDRRSLRALTSAGWCVLVIWECEIADAQALGAQIQTFLQDEA